MVSAKAVSVVQSSYVSGLDAMRRTMATPTISPAAAFPVRDIGAGVLSVSTQPKSDFRKYHTQHDERRGDQPDECQSELSKPFGKWLHRGGGQRRDCGEDIPAG